MKKQKIMRSCSSNRGITLVALVITIIVLLILAGVAIRAVVGDNGVLSQSTKASEESKYKSAVEQVETQLVYLEEGTNVGKVDIDTTHSNLKKLKEKNSYITNVGDVDEDTNSFIVTFANGKTKLIEGSQQDWGAKWFYSENGDGTITITGPRIVKYLEVNEDNVFDIMYEQFCDRYPTAKANGDINSEQVLILDEITSLEKFKSAYTENKLYNAPYEILFTEIMGENLDIDIDDIVFDNLNDTKICTWKKAIVSKIENRKDDDEDKRLVIDGVESWLYSIDLNLPDEIDGKTVTKIADRAFYIDSSIPEGVIRLPSNLKDIGAKAFYGVEDFGDVENSTLIIPDSVETIGSRAFRRMEIGAKTTVTDKDGDEDVVRNCHLIINGTNLKSIGEEAFEESTFYGDITLKNSVTVGNGAFNYTDVNVTYVD